MVAVSLHQRLGFNHRRRAAGQLQHASTDTLLALPPLRRDSKKSSTLERNSWPSFAE